MSAAATRHLQTRTDFRHKDDTINDKDSMRVRVGIIASEWAGAKQKTANIQEGESWAKSPISTRTVVLLSTRSALGGPDSANIVPRGVGLTFAEPAVHRRPTGVLALSLSGLMPVRCSPVGVVGCPIPWNGLPVRAVGLVRDGLRIDRHVGPGRRRPG